MDRVLEDTYTHYVKWDRNQTTCNAIKVMHSEQKYDELKKLLMHRMEFGTAGLRARMGPGYSQMNDLTIIQTSQGLLKYAKQQCPTLKSSGIMIGYDARRNSRKWGMYLANIFANEGITVYHCDDYLATPMVAFGVRHFKTSLGVVITASHNPKDDNGYKVYWSNGAQIISPHDKGIATCIEESLEPLDSSWNLDAFHEKPTIKKLDGTFYGEYLKMLTGFQKPHNPSSYKFTYTPMHGVGLRFVMDAVKAFGPYDLHPVPLQAQPNCDFPTVAFPNPEEGKSALNLSIELANSIDSRIILANDPDADRLAVAEKQPDGQWKIFNGNELGALFGWWIFKQWRADNPSADVSKVGMVSSTVSSKILETYAKAEGFHFEETLTGFKWMGNKAHDLAPYNKTLFAFEEAIGFMTNNAVLDKDGISALVVMCELATDAYNKKSSVQGRLEEIYAKYGQHISNNGYYISYDKEKIDGMFARLRHWPTDPTPQGYPKRLGRFDITGVRDLTTGYDNNYPDTKPRLPVSAGSHCLTFTFANGVSLTLRTSGTEPKIKWYSELRAKPNSGKSREDLIKELGELIKVMIQDFYQPEQNGFKAQPGS